MTNLLLVSTSVGISASSDQYLLYIGQDKELRKQFVRDIVLLRRIGAFGPGLSDIKMIEICCFVRPKRTDRALLTPRQYHAGSRMIGVRTASRLQLISTTLER